MESESKSAIDRDPYATLFYSAGLCLFAAQSFENVVRFFIFVGSQTGEINLPPEEADSLLESKKPLAQLVKVVKKHAVPIDERQELALDRARVERNRFVHGYLVERTFLWMESREVFERMILEIGSIRNTIREGEVVLRELADNLLPKVGIDEELKASLIARAKMLRQRGWDPSLFDEPN